MVKWSSGQSKSKFQKDATAPICQLLAVVKDFNSTALDDTQCFRPTAYTDATILATIKNFLNAYYLLPILSMYLIWLCAIVHLIIFFITLLSSTSSWWMFFMM